MPLLPPLEADTTPIERCHASQLIAAGILDMVVTPLIRRFSRPLYAILFRSCQMLRRLLSAIRIERVAAILSTPLATLHYCHYGACCHCRHCYATLP